MKKKGRIERKDDLLRSGARGEDSSAERAGARRVYRPFSLAAFFALLRGGKREGIVRLRRAAEAGDFVAQAFVEAYDTASSEERRPERLESIAYKAGVSQGMVTESLTRVVCAEERQKAKAIMAAGLPELMRISLEVSQKAENVKERRMHLEQGEMAPQRGRSSININQTTEIANVVPERGLPTLVSEIGGLDNLLREADEQKALQAAAMQITEGQDTNYTQEG